MCLAVVAPSVGGNSSIRLRGHQGHWFAPWHEFDLSFVLLALRAEFVDLVWRCLLCKSSHLTFTIATGVVKVLHRARLAHHLSLILLVAAVLLQWRRRPLTVQSGARCMFLAGTLVLAVTMKLTVALFVHAIIVGVTCNTWARLPKSDIVFDSNSTLAFFRRIQCGLATCSGGLRDLRRGV